MDETPEWRELAARFTELGRADRNQLHACWNSTAFNDRGEHWFISGSPEQPVIESFKWAAERAAVLLGQPTGESTLFYWLDLLRENSPRYAGGGQSQMRADDGTIATAETGTIMSVCLASAEYCYKLETAAIAKKRAVWVPVEPLGIGSAWTERNPISPFTEKALRVIARKFENEREPVVIKHRRANESIGSQLDRLREECRMTVEDLATALDVDSRSVYRHLAFGACENVPSSARLK